MKTFFATVIIWVVVCVALWYAGSLCLESERHFLATHPGTDIPDLPWTAMAAAIFHALAFMIAVFGIVVMIPFLDLCAKGASKRTPTT